MASRSLGTLTVDLIANIGGFTGGLDKADREAQKKAKSIAAALDNVFAGIAVAAAAAVTGVVAAFAGLQKAVDAVGAFQDLAERTGASAEGLASFAIAAGTAGASMEDIAGASIKLTKNLTGVDDESKAAGAAIAALGLNLKDFKELSPEKQIEAVAKALGQFEEGAGKTAVALDLFGKSGAALLPFLKTLEEQGGGQVVLTDKLIQQADEYGDRQAKARAELTLYAQALAVQVLPALSAFTGALTDTIKEILGLDKASGDLANNNAVAKFAEGAVKALGFVIDAVDGVSRAFDTVGKYVGAVAAGTTQLFTGEFRQALNTAKEFNSDVDQILSKPLFSAKLEKRLAEVTQAANNPAPAVKRPTLNYAGKVGKAGGGSTDDPTKKLLDNELKTLQRYIDDERDLMQERNKFLDLYNGQGLISIKDYYAQRQTILDEATKNQIEAYNQQIEALRRYQANAPKQTDRADAEGKINDLISKRARLERDAGAAAIEASIKQQDSVRAYQDSISELNAKLLELQGNLGAAAKIRFDIQNRSLRSRINAEEDDAARKTLDRVEELGTAQANLNKLQGDYSLIQGDLQIAEERIALGQKLGTQGQIEGLAKLRDARTDSLKQLTAIYDEYRKIADASGNPQMVQNADRLKLSLEQLAAEVDPLADKINTLFADQFTNALDGILDGTKTVQEAFKGMVSAIIKELARLAVQDVAKSLFSGGGSSTGGVGFDLGSLFSSLFAGARANGGPVMPNSLYKVNERGPEIFEAANGSQYLMTGTESGRVLPNGGMSPTIIVNVPNHVNRNTGTQIAADTSRKLMQGNRNR